MKDEIPDLSIDEFGISFDTGEIYKGTENGNEKLEIQQVPEIVKTLVTPSDINGNIIVDGEELKVYDDTEIRNLIQDIDQSKAEYELSDLTDVEISNPQDADVLSYNANSKGWESKIISGIHDINCILEDFVEEEVILIDNEAPKDVTAVIVSNVEQTSFIINWTESVSKDTQAYNIYKDEELVGTIQSTNSKLTPLYYKLDNLSPSTEYEVTIKTNDKQGNESDGYKKKVTTNGNKAIFLNGETDYIKLPAITFDKIELVCKVDVPEEDGTTWYTYLDARAGVSTAFIALNGNGNPSIGSVWAEVLVDGESHDLHRMKQKEKFTLLAKLRNMGTDDINIFSSYKDIPAMKGSVYLIKVYLENNNLVALYDFTNEFEGDSVEDGSGNGNTAKLIGGNWIVG